MDVFLCILAGVVIILTLRQFNNNYASLAIVILSIITVTSVINKTSGIMTSLESYLSNTSLSMFNKTLYKAFGISILAETISDICKDAGASTLAARVEFAAKAELILISIPIIEKILAMTHNLFV